MKGDMFDELVSSVCEGGAILRGEKAPARTFVVDGPIVRRLRSSYQLSQNVVRPTSRQKLEKAKRRSKTA